MPRRKPDLFSRWEHIILRLTVCCLILLAATQAMFLFEIPRHFLSQVDRLEGEAVSWQTPLAVEVPLAAGPEAPAAPASYRRDRLRSGREIVLRIVQPPADREAYLLVNGRRQGDFAAGELSLTVYDGDYLEIDAGQRTTPVRLIVRQPDGGLDTPVDGSVIEGVGLIPVGKVNLKR